MLFILLAVLVLAISLNAWHSPVQAVSLIITMHGVRQVAITQVSSLSSRPYLFNLFVASIAIVAMIGSQMRKKRDLIHGNYLGVMFPYFIFYSIFFIGAISCNAFDVANFSLLIKRCVPYIILQLIAVPLLISRSTPNQINQCFFSTALICCVIMMIVATDSSVRVDEGFEQMRLQLAVEDANVRGSNPLALADIGVLLLITTAFLPPAVLKLNNVTIMGSQGIHFLRHSLKVLFMLATLTLTLFMSRAEPILGVLAIVLTILASTLRVKNSFTFILLLLTTTILLSMGLPTVLAFLVTYFPRFDSVSEAMDIRMFLWTNSISNYVNGNFLTLFFGLGPGFSMKSVGIYPHNSIVECLTELGLLGFIFWVSCTLKPLSRGLAELNALPRGMVRQNACVIISLLIYSILVSLKRGSIVSPSIFMWGIALLFYYSNAARQRLKKTGNSHVDGADVIMCPPYSKNQFSQIIHGL